MSKTNHTTTPEPRPPTLIDNVIAYATVAAFGGLIGATAWLIDWANALLAWSIG
ncbi:hypothetical protein [Nocardia niwae]|uniref:hypothetical protein n=1 Tax=Nocardia niwae TaxID=626084 RepID=UPI000AB36C7D|nr:hypothetical protein [Nocardia niwae]